ncbi:DNA cytosine methyltransferase [Flavobacterium sp.]|uniref:DNA cytosine methyltransferase n=1 Tax=Flavobacterium sp. TaxID=239 RepID=UPI00326470D9
MRHLSLFSGCGGMDAGLAASGSQCALAIDIDSKPLRTLSHNLTTPTLAHDLNIPMDLAAFRDIDLLACGPPCQGFSTIGFGDPHDPRNSLLTKCVEIAAHLRPRVVVVENVLGLGSRKHSVLWQNVQSSLRTLGYKTQVLCIDMRALGLPQSRQRLILFAWLGQFNGQLEFDHKEPASLGSHLHNVSGSNHEPQFLAKDSRANRIAERIPPGASLCNVRLTAGSVRTWSIPEVFGATTARERRTLEALSVLRRRERTRKWGDADPVSKYRIDKFLGSYSGAQISTLLAAGYIKQIDIGTEIFFDLLHTFNGKFKRPHPDLWSPTVDTRFGDPNYFLHPIENRAFTVREAARIQGFSDTFRFHGTKRDQFRSIGNAVPPPAGLLIGTLVRRIL